MQRANDNTHDNGYRILVRIGPIDMKMFNPLTICSNCRHEFVSDEEIVICSICKAMSLITDCRSPVQIKFTGKIAKGKVSFNLREEAITNCFAIAMNKKLALAKFMLNSKVDIVYWTKTSL